MDNPVKDIFARLQRILENIKALLDNLDNFPGQMRATVSRVAVEGRQVTNVLQNLRSKVVGFDDWYKNKSEEMRNDKMLRFFYQLRSEILKEGIDRIGGAKVRPQPNSQIELSGTGLTVTKFLDDGQIRIIKYLKPENTISFFMGDQNGGSGFIIKTLDGKEKKHYVYIPPNVADISVFFETPPTEHNGKEIEDTNPRNLCTLYYEYLLQLCEEANNKFNKMSMY